MIKVVKFFLKSSWKQIILIAFASIVAAGLNVLSLKYLKEIILVSEDKRYSYFAFIILLVLLAMLVTLLMEKYSTSYFESKLVSYREEISNRLLLTKYEAIEKKLARLTPILMTDINEISDFGRLIPAFIVATAQIITIMGYLFYLSWKLALIIFILLFIIIIIMYSVLPQMKKIKDKRSKSRFRLHSILILMNNGFKNLLMNHRHGKSYISQTIKPSSLEVSKYNEKIHLFQVGVEQLINSLFIVGFGLTIILYFMWIQISSQIGLEFIALLLFIVPSFIRILDFFNQLKNAENSLDQIDSLNADISQEVVLVNKEISYTPQINMPLLSMKNIEYAYPASSNHVFTIGPIDLTIMENEIVLIKGGNGSGKTTLFNILLGLYEHKKGQIYFQNTEIKEENIRCYRNFFSCYFTESPVFDNLNYISKENLDKGKEYIADLELEEKTAIRTDFIADTSLSFGQRGRLNLLRLLLENKPIYILDEWAANQDIYFKEKFYKKIIPNLKKQGKTIILISHDDKYYDIADKIVTLRNGQLESIV